MGEKRKLTSQKNERRIERDLDEEGNVSAKDQAFTGGNFFCKKIHQLKLGQLIKCSLSIVKLSMTDSRYV